MEVWVWISSVIHFHFVVCHIMHFILLFNQIHICFNSQCSLPAKVMAHYFTVINIYAKTAVIDVVVVVGWLVHSFIDNWYGNLNLFSTLILLSWFPAPCILFPCLMGQSYQ